MFFKLTQWIKWILFGHLIVDAGAVSYAAAPIAPEIDEQSQTETMDGYLQYYDNGFPLRVDLKEGITSVGSSRLADCVVNCPNMSAKHAEIKREGGSYSITNVSSEDNIYVNGDLLTKNSKMTLQAGMILILAGIQMEFRRWSKANQGA